MCYKGSDEKFIDDVAYYLCVCVCVYIYIYIYIHEKEIVRYIDKVYSILTPMIPLYYWYNYHIILYIVINPMGLQFNLEGNGQWLWYVLLTPLIYLNEFSTTF